MRINLKVTAALLVLACAPLQLHATAQDQQAIPRDSSGEPLTAKEVRQLEKTAINAADHRQLAAYYEFQAQQADKKLADAQELERKWGPMERATKTPDPYPHARRLVNEYTAQVQNTPGLQRITSGWQRNTTLPRGLSRTAETQTTEA